MIKIGKQGIIKSVIELNKISKEVSYSDLQGMVGVISMDIIKGNDKKEILLRNEVDNHILAVLNKADGNMSKPIIGYITYQIGILKDYLKSIGYKVL